MADSAESEELFWVDPPERAIIPLDHHFHIPQRLRRTARHHLYQIKLNSNFTATMRSCAAPRPKHPTTWINAEIIALYSALHKQGHAHSIEIWSGDAIVGGLYGVSLGSAFFGESMFSRARDVSKLALIYLVALLRGCGFTLLDTQFQTEHLSQFGAYEITRAEYHALLQAALTQPAQLAEPSRDQWDSLVGSLLQPITQRS